MPSRENTIIAVCVVLAVVSALFASWVAQMGESVILGILLFVGVVLPTLLNESVETSAAAESE